MVGSTVLRSVLGRIQIGLLRIVAMRRYQHDLPLCLAVALHVTAEVALLGLLGALKYLTELMCQRRRVHLGQRSGPRLLLVQHLLLLNQGRGILVSLLLEHLHNVLLDLLRQHVLDGHFEAVLEAELAREVRSLVLLTPVHNDVFWR